MLYLLSTIYIHKNLLTRIKTSDQLHSGPAVSAFDSLRPLIPNIIELKTHLQCVTLLGLSGKAQKIHRIFCVIDHVYNTAFSIVHPCMVTSKCCGWKLDGSLEPALPQFLKILIVLM